MIEQIQSSALVALYEMKRPARWIPPTKDH